MSENNKVIPSLAVALKIEEVTSGRVKAKDLYAYAQHNREVTDDIRPGRGRKKREAA